MELQDMEPQGAPRRHGRCAMAACLRATKRQDAPHGIRIHAARAAQGEPTESPCVLALGALRCRRSFRVTCVCVYQFFVRSFVLVRSFHTTHQAARDHTRHLCARRSPEEYSLVTVYPPVLSSGFGTTLSINGQRAKNRQCNLNSELTVSHSQVVVDCYRY